MMGVTPRPIKNLFLESQAVIDIQDLD